MGRWISRMVAGIVLTTHATATVLWSPQTEVLKPRITHAEFVPGAGFSIAFEAPPGSYGLEFSEDLGPPPWQNLATLDPTTGQAAYLDALALTRARGFYRVAGSFTVSNYHSLTPGFAVEAGFANASVNQGPRGELHCGNSTADLLLEYQGAPSGCTRSTNSQFIECYIRPEIPELIAFTGTRDDADTPLSFTSDGWQINIPAGPYPLPQLPQGEVSAAASEFRFREMEADGTSLVALGLRTYQGDVHPESDEPESFQGKKLELPFLIQKSTDADVDDLAGEWGMVNLAVSGELTPQGTNLPPTLPGRIRYAVSAAVAQITALSNTESSMFISREVRFEAQQSFDPLDGTSVTSGESLEFYSLEMILRSNGAVEMRDIQETEPVFLRGAVSPTAGLIVVAGSIPAADSGPDNEFFPPGDFTGSQLAVAVRREINPLLAGRSYQAIRVGFYVTAGGFEISRWNPGAQVTFNAGGSAATIAADQEFYSATFDGAAQSETFTPGSVFNVQVAADGMISLLAAPPSLQLTEYAGFAQLGADLIILGGSLAEAGDGAEVSMLILVPGT